MMKIGKACPQNCTNDCCLKVGFQAIVGVKKMCEQTNGNS